MCIVIIVNQGGHRISYYVASCRIALPCVYIYIYTKFGWAATTRRLRAPSRWVKPVAATRGIVAHRGARRRGGGARWRVGTLGEHGRGV